MQCSRSMLLTYAVHPCYHTNMKNRRETIYRYQVHFQPNGMGYTVTVPKLPGLVTEGGSLAEARRMAKDAIRCHIEGILKDVSPISRNQVLHKERLSVRM